jgi:hypothetical protein
MHKAVVDRLDKVSKQLAIAEKSLRDILAAYTELPSESSGEPPVLAADADSVVEKIFDAMDLVTKLNSQRENIFKTYKSFLLHELTLGRSIRIENTEQTQTLRSGNFQISIWTSLTKESRLFRIPVKNGGRLWSHILLFVESVCGPITGTFALKDMQGRDVISSIDDYVRPGDYALVPISGTVSLRINETRFPIVPCGSMHSSRSPSAAQSAVASTTDSDAGLASTSPVKKRRIESDADSEKVNRKSTFTTKLYQRDNHCVITRDCLSLEGAHILAHAWWTPADNRRHCLPKEIINAVKDFHDEIDDVCNGLLLRTDLTRSFDSGYFSLQLDEEKQHYRVVSLHPLCDELNGIIIDENTRLRSDGQTWWGGNFPSPVLVAFHLKNSVFANLVAAGSDYPERDWDDPEMASPIRAGSPFGECDICEQATTVQAKISDDVDESQRKCLAKDFSLERSTAGVVCNPNLSVWIITPCLCVAGQRLPM